jgi:hypothetical protein|nr:MAG TPA: protein of unknown function (DUF5320) [Caudoviricetes sp.]
MCRSNVEELKAELAEIDAKIKSAESELSALYCERDSILDKMDACDNADDQYERGKDDTL